jgi:hypothetical protein
MQPPAPPHVPHADDAHRLEMLVAANAAVGLIPPSPREKRALAKQRQEEKEVKEKRLYVRVSELQRVLFVYLFLQFGDSKQPSWYWYVSLSFFFSFFFLFMYAYLHARVCYIAFPYSMQWAAWHQAVSGGAIHKAAAEGH